MHAESTLLQVLGLKGQDCSTQLKNSQKIKIFMKNFYDQAG